MHVYFMVLPSLNTNLGEVVQNTLQEFRFLAWAYYVFPPRPSGTFSRSAKLFREMQRPFSIRKDLLLALLVCNNFIVMYSLESGLASIGFSSIDSLEFSWYLLASICLSPWCFRAP